MPHRSSLGAQLCIPSQTDSWLLFRAACAHSKCLSKLAAVLDIHSSHEGRSHAQAGSLHAWGKQQLPASQDHAAQRTPLQHVHTPSLPVLTCKGHIFGQSGTHASPEGADPLQAGALHNRNLWRLMAGRHLRVHLLCKRGKSSTDSKVQAEAELAEPLCCWLLGSRLHFQGARWGSHASPAALLPLKRHMQGVAPVLFFTSPGIPDTRHWDLLLSKAAQHPRRSSCPGRPVLLSGASVQPP